MGKRSEVTCNLNSDSTNTCSKFRYNFLNKQITKALRLCCSQTPKTEANYYYNVVYRKLTTYAILKRVLGPLGGGGLWGRGARLHAISILTVQIHSGATGIDHEIIKII